jgi:excisionase family DNA binding protein
MGHTTVSLWQTLGTSRKLHVCSNGHEFLSDRTEQPVDATATTGGEWIGIEQLAKELGVPVRTIYQWRSRGSGPRGATFGRHVRFRRSEIEKWIATRLDEPRAVG